MATVFERVSKVVVDRLGVEEGDIKPEASFVDDLKADSLDLVELIMAFEEEFTENGDGLKISDEDAEAIRTVQNAVDYIKDKGFDDE